MRMSKSRTNIFRGASVYTLVSVVSLLYIFPFLWMVFTSLKPITEVNRIPITIIPQNPTWQNYVAATARGEVLLWFMNSVKISFSSTFTIIMVASLAAFGFARFRFSYKKPLFMLVLFYNCIPSVVLMVPIYVILRNLGVINNQFGLFLVYVVRNMPFAVWVTRGYFEGIHKELEEAALLDGCSRLGMLFRIFFPIALPGIISVSLITLASIWGEFILAYTYLSSRSLLTLPPGLNFFMEQGFVDWGMISAVATITVMPNLTIFLFMQKFLKAGLTAGAIKG